MASSQSSSNVEVTGPEATARFVIGLARIVGLKTEKMQSSSED